jgi:malate dehydrogenase (oxaloacetate-decarboxylating)(NADP+)
MPDVAKAARPDAVIATGRSDFPNQVNNVLCFPFIFRGALDVRARDITTGMKIACAKALAGLAREEAPEYIREAYGVAELSFGRDYLIPKPFDRRVFVRASAAVAEAAIRDGVARNPLVIADYRAELERKAERLSSG